MKSITPLSIDEEVKKQAKERGLNLSAIAETAIREKLGKRQFEIDMNADHCEWCNVNGEPENPSHYERSVTDTREILSNPTDLCWLWPDEQWVCNRCLRTASKNITKW